MADALFSSDTDSLPKTKAQEAVLTEAVRHLDIVHTSLAGMTAIVLTLLVAAALPVLGLHPITHSGPVIVMAIASFVGIGVLYAMNYRVHKHVVDQARLTEVLVNSLGQGFLVFDRNGICGKVYSQACLDLLECIPAEKSIGDVLRVTEEQKADFKEWFEILFQPDHALGFDDVIKFLPAYFPHNQQRRVALVYKPIYRKDGKLINVVVIATDQSEEYAAQQAAKKQQVFAEMICRIFKDRNQFHTTLSHLREFLDDAGATDVGLKDSGNLLRELHTLKATVKQFSLMELGDIIHQVESDLRNPLIGDDERFCEELRKGRQMIADALLKVTDEVSGLMGGEHEWRGNVREVEEKDLYEFADKMKHSGCDASLIQTYLSTIAAVPIFDCLRSFDRGLKELATMMDKQVKAIQFEGTNPRVLTQPIQEFLFSLSHIYRNIMDHGIETPVTRMARGKDPAGQVTVFAEIIPDTSKGRDWLHIVISDDGNGIDPSKVRSKLATMDPEGDWRFEDDQTVIQRIFGWGFTTSETLTTVSGRGVGMEAVEREVKLLGGSVRVFSELYKGCRFDIRIPYFIDIEASNSSFREKEMPRIETQAEK